MSKLCLFFFSLKKNTKAMRAFGRDASTTISKERTNKNL